MDDDSVEHGIEDEKIIHITRKKRKKKISVNPANADVEDNSDIDINTICQENKKLKEAQVRVVQEAEPLREDNNTLRIDQRYNDLIKIINEQNKIIENLRKELSQFTTARSSVDYVLEDEARVDEFPPLTTQGTVQNVQQSSVPLSEMSTPAVQKGIGVKSVSTNAALKKPRTMQMQLPPPITVYNIDTKTVIQKTKNALKNNNFNINIVNKNITKIMPQQSADHEKIVEIFKNDNIKFYTYTPRDKKPFSFIIKKLPLCFDIEDVKEAITSLDMNVSIEKIFKTNYKWIVQLKNSSDINEFKSIKFLLHCRVQIENVKRNRVMQCKNCQRFNHTASNCNMPYRCVKCCESHKPGDCKIPKKELNTETFVLTDEKTGEKKNVIGIPVQCVNCGKAGHTANSSICEIRQQILKKTSVTKQSQVVVHHQLRNNKISYASLLSNPKDNRDSKINNDKGEFFDKINNDCAEIFGKNLFTCISKVGEFKEKYISLKSKEEKTKALFNLFLTLQLDD